MAVLVIRSASTVAVISLVFCVSQVWATATARAEMDDPIRIQDSAATTTGLTSCSRVKTYTKVRIQQINVPSPAGDVKFTRSYFNGASVDNYVNGCQTSTTSSTSFKDCADQSATAGKHGFEFSGSTCTSYVFHSLPCPCTRGDTVLYVDLMMVADLPIDPTLAGSETEDYITLLLDLTTLSEFDLPDMGLVEVTSATTFEDCLAYDTDTSPAFTFSDGVCTNFETGTPVPAEGLEGLEGCAGTTVYKRKPFETAEIKYFNDSCGTTIETPLFPKFDRIYSHSGLLYEPLPENVWDCVVTFVEESSCNAIYFHYEPLYLDANEACTAGDFVKFGWDNGIPPTFSETTVCGDSKIPTELLNSSGNATTIRDNFTVTLTQDQAYEPAILSDGFYIDYSCQSYG